MRRSRPAAPLAVHPLWPALGISILLTALVYGRVLSFPFDDIIHMRWLRERSSLGPRVDVAEMQHYRPLPFSIWALSMRLFGAYTAWPLHLLSLLLHAANGGLVGWLAGCSSERTHDPPQTILVAVVAAALLVTFPFSYQVMPSPGSHSKPLSTFLILLACLGYERWRQGHRPRWLLLALMSGLLAPFAYEAGVTVGGYLLLLEVLRWRREQPFSPYALLLPLLGVPFLLAWKAVPSGYDPLSFPGWEALWQSSVYFVQGLTWPLALLARPLMRYGGLSDLAATAVVAYGTLLALAAVTLWRRRSAILGFALGWYALSLVVQWVTLSFRYIIDGPRILYTASVGMTLLWTEGILVDSSRRIRNSRFLGALRGIALSAMVAWGAYFGSMRLSMVAGTLSVLERATAVALAADPAERLLFVNIPSWIAPPQEAFALGHEGYTLLPPYYGVALGDFVEVNTGVRRDIRMGLLPDIRREWWVKLGYHHGARGYEELAELIRSSDRVWVPTYEERRLGLIEVGGTRRGGAPIPKGPPVARYTAALTLHQVAVEREGETLRVALLWSTQDALQGPYTVFVHLIGPGGLIAQADGYPLGGLFPLHLWQRGDVVRDLRYLSLPPEVELASCTLGIGLYRSDNGERAPALGPDDARLADDMARIAIDD